MDEERSDSSIAPTSITNNFPLIASLIVVFVTPKTPATSTSAPVYTLAYFTPTCEINLCGHATLAAASVLFSVPEIPSSPHLDFVTRSGIKLRATNPTPKEVQLDFPENPPSEVTNEDLVGLVEDVVRVRGAHSV